MSGENNPQESPEEIERIEAIHKQLVDSGKFDEIPKVPVKVGDIVAVRGDNVRRKVYNVSENEVIVGYDSPSGKQIRESLPLNDIRDAQGYQNAILKLMGWGHKFEIKVEGSVSMLRDKTRDN